MKDYSGSTIDANGCMKDNDVMLSYFDGLVVGIYAGKSLASDTISSMIDHLSARYNGLSNATVSMLAEICGQENDMDHTAGVAVALETDIDYVQSALLSWNQGECASKPKAANDQSTSRELIIHQIPLPATVSSKAKNSTDMKFLFRGLEGFGNTAQLLDTNANAKYCIKHQIVLGDSCTSIAKACKISVADFLKYNDVKGDGDDWCRKLQTGKNACCSSGSSKPLPEDNGDCFTYTIKADDDCQKIGLPWNLTPKDIEGFNDKVTWGWRGCPDLTIGLKICLSKGSPPMPAPVSNAVCGPQKPGTVSPGPVKDASALAKLNPCPLNSCCNIWGQCGIDSLFCTKADGPTGNPGTAPPRSNGCISNCGTDVVNNDKPPSSGFQRIGYYEAFNWERPCLHMRSVMSNTQKYTHMHWAFGDVKSDMSVSVNDTYGQWDGFIELKDIKKIVSFGGWGFSTGVASYEVLRKAMSPESRDRFISNIVSFVEEANVDGIDLDWEYPGAADIPGIPAGLPSDTHNYLDTLRALRKALPAKYSLSIAVPASYWYLRPFPIQEMSQVVDYLVYMAYDLHGQWDVGNGWAMSGCPGGNCLRSHVNQTEVMLALSMITKAGVNANKVVVGESSYGRSFRMAKAGCTGPNCTFTGANGHSDASKGRCTNASGYLSNAEINEIISKSSKSKKTWFDKDTASDYLVYDDVEWVAYMSDHTKEMRRDKWKQLNFGGSVDWAVDLQEFNGADTFGPHGKYNSSSCIQVFDDMIWDWLNPSIEAVVGCTNILQPSPLPAAVTLTAYTTITLQSGTSFSTTVVSAPFSISEVSYQPFTFNESDISSLGSGLAFTYNPTPRITPNPVTILIPTGWTVTGIGKATKEESSTEPSKSIIGLPQATSTTTSSHGGIGFLLPITWLPTVSYRIPSMLTPKPPAPTELPDDDEQPIVNPPTPPGIVDCQNDSCTKGQDCENDEWARNASVEEIAWVLIVNEEEFVKEKHAKEEAAVLKSPPEAAILESARAKAVSLDQSALADNARDSLSNLFPVQRALRDCTEFISVTEVQTKPTTSWSTTTRTQCENVVDCDAADMTVTTTIKSSSEEPDPTYIAKVVGYEGMKLLRNEDLFASIATDEDEFFSLLESPATTTSEIISTSAEEATPEPTPAAPEVTCGIALYAPIMWRLDIIDMTGSWVLDDEGESLKKEVKGCGAVTGWEWFKRADGTRECRFNLPLLMKKGIMTATIKLYTNHGCPWAHRAHIALAELKIPFEEEIIDLGVPRTPEYLAINPRGLVPSLSYNGQIITESAIVAQFLADAYPSHLVPNAGTPEAALTRARINFFVDTFFSKVNSLYHKALFAKTEEEAEEASAEFVKQLEKEVEPLLSDAAPYFGGSKTLTLAEVLTGSFILRLLSLPKNGVGPESLIKELPTKTPNFYKWATTVVEHPSVNGIWNEEKVVSNTKARLAKLKA
ncbi:CAZyme family GH18 [Trichoderma aggressivum f. europaeum]|uniref:chitinase n=1 Tax=Trichoderma aggressivum f. europaeum TaxID=173218 RepID=A0AAE1LVM7_9HYPO|nr:CAZyme family GH18 [Trichoderma aggressivum f. europaeum]